MVSTLSGTDTADAVASFADQAACMTAAEWVGTAEWEVEGHCWRIRGWEVLAWLLSMRAGIG